MTEHININVTGNIGAGKSAVIQIIYKALVDSGLSPVIIAPEHDLRDKHALDRAVRSMIIQMTTIDIQEIYRKNISPVKPTIGGTDR